MDLLTLKPQSKMRRMRGVCLAVELRVYGVCVHPLKCLGVELLVYDDCSHTLKCSGRRYWMAARLRLSASHFNQMFGNASTERLTYRLPAGRVVLLLVRTQLPYSSCSHF